MNPISNSFENVILPLEKFSDALRRAAAIILDTKSALTDAVESITLGVFYVSEAVDKTFFNWMNGAVNTMNQLYRVLVPIVQGLSTSLSVLDSFKSQIDSKFSSVVAAINWSLGRVQPILDSFEWVKTVYSKVLRFSLPCNYEVKKWCWWGPCEFGVKYCSYYISIQRITNWINDIKRLIMRIPFVGWLWVSAISFML